MDLSKTFTYKGMMYSDVPNLASAFGYTNASWTLKCDLTAEYVCRLLKHMDQHGYAQCTPRVNDPELTAEPAIDFTSGYVLRALHTLPRQGSKTPWRVHLLFCAWASASAYRPCWTSTIPKVWCAAKKLADARDLVVVYAGTDDRDKAFAWLEKAFADRSVFLVFLKLEPMMETLHSDPRWKDLERRVGISES